MIPRSYRKPVPSVPLLAPDATAGQVLIALDGQTTQLDQANGRTSDVIAIADTCQDRQQAVLKALDPPPWYAGLLDRLKPPAAHAPP